MDAFTFGLDVKPDSSMVIRSTLGNVRVRCDNQFCCTIHDYPLHAGQRPGESKWPVMHFIVLILSCYLCAVGARCCTWVSGCPALPARNVSWELE